ncbi:ProQ/FinO family protein [Legionella waltersii]|uniref:ProQ n=1 Tax=Legionella waltersii TaxID=66969 RepID=A0A0W1A6L8_9GAMM|nr:ProQ/FinO family protein [Legionella waltersii]KTD76643.1 ProQ [Legionella waltersii]SNU94764.1 ProQ [Legionella waltersii]
MRTQELHPRTAVINKTQKNQAKRARSEALTWLAAKFPESFDNSLRIRPLKIGIMKDILDYADEAAAAGISKSKLREAVVVFSRRLDYLACLKAKEMRINLFGDAVAEVTVEEAEHAALKIKKRIEKSVKNARKSMVSKSSSQQLTNDNYYGSSKGSQHELQDESYSTVYPLRSSAYSQQSSQTPPVNKAPAVIVKHKATKQFDPDAVARLKAKLGLSIKANETKETAE